MNDEWPLLRGPRPEDATCALILIHGRGAMARGLLPLADAVAMDDTPVLAPQADGHTWYPDRFLAPREANEPFLSSALDVVEDLVRRLENVGIPRRRILLSGFSQGACLALEFVARHPTRYAGCVALAGALIGPDPLEGDYSGNLAGTPVHLAVGDRDVHVPPRYVDLSARVLERLGAVVSTRIRVSMGHDVHPDDVAILAHLVSGIE